MNEEILYERKYLENTINLFDDVIKKCNIRLDNYIKHYNENNLLYSKLIYDINHKLNLLDRLKCAPYFARIDFDDNNKKAKYYIGKTGILDDNNNPITIDWRSPIAALYYDSNLGDASYIAPEGEIKGTLLLKRQFNIANKILNSYQDIDTTTSDEILKPYLSTNMENRLKNIVATIQNEQNSIIRENILNNIIVQGVAGSGKTTVALHRIAYLAYNHQDNINIKDYLVIGPNRYFVKYISNVLPDLDVDDVKQIVFDDLLLDNIKSLKINDVSENLKRAINKENLDFKRYKVSLDFKDYIDCYLDKYINDFILNKDLYIEDLKILNNSIIKEYYNSVNNNEILNYKIERTISLLMGYVKNNYSYLLNKITENYFRVGNKKTYDIAKKKLNSYFKSDFKKLLNISSINIINLYKDILLSLNNDAAIEDIDRLNHKKCENEDLPALLYLYYRIFGNDKFSNIKHTVIDEAQDYGLFNFYVLSKLLNNSTFSIYGDLAQSLYSYKSINSWDEVLPIFNNSKLCSLNKSYRTTIEILTFANRINNHLNLNKADAVIRHGKDVCLIKSDNLKNIEKKIEEYINEGYISIALIVKDIKEYDYYKYYINNELLSKITIITSYDSKGLEFDAVIIPSIDEEVYDSNNILDMKLLYVSITRSLHELTCFYKENITKALKN